jgi:hypothetical protein
MSSVTLVPIFCPAEKPGFAGTCEPVLGYRSWTDIRMSTRINPAFRSTKLPNRVNIQRDGTPDSRIGGASLWRGVMRAQKNYMASMSCTCESTFTTMKQMIPASATAANGTQFVDGASLREAAMPAGFRSLFAVRFFILSNLLVVGFRCLHIQQNQPEYIVQD